MNPFKIKLYIKNGKVLKALGIGFLAFAGLYVLMAVTGGLTVEEGDNIVSMVINMVAFFGGIGAVMLFFGCRFLARGKKFNRYVAILSDCNEYAIDNIAAAYPTTYDVAVKDLQKMIDLGCFFNAYIDMNKRELVMQKLTSSDIPSVAKSTAPGTRTVKCPNCGATNTIAQGAASKCEYCGSPL